MSEELRIIVFIVILVFTAPIWLTFLTSFLGITVYLVSGVFLLITEMERKVFYSYESPTPEQKRLHRNMNFGILIMGSINGLIALVGFIRMFLNHTSKKKIKE